MEENEARKVVDTLRERGVDAHLERAGTFQFGVRIALGATSDRVVRQIVNEGLLVTSSGLILAWLIAAMVKMHLFTGGGAGAWTVLMIVPIVLVGVAAVSCWLPAKRATLVDPVVALRSE